MRWRSWASALGAVLLLLNACGGSGPGDSTASIPTGPAANVAPLVVDGGPAGMAGVVNAAFVSVTICVPGTNSCQSVDHVSVDTGSSGLRLVASALTAPDALPARMDAAGSPLGECMAFADGYSWGSVRVADIRIAGEQAAAQSVQIIGDGGFAGVPADCMGLGVAEDTVQSLGANGILGVGVFAQDCGALCTSSIPSPALYDSCPASASCQGTLVPLLDQLQNPVSQFGADGAGVIIQLPAIDAAGSVSVTGSLIFGIDSESNNRLGPAALLPVDAASGNFITDFGGQSYPQSFADSGSAAIFFPDGTTAVCPSGLAPGYYCPSSVQTLSATLSGAGGAGSTSSVSFTVANAQALLGNNTSFLAFEDLAAPNPLGGGYFTWGLPFFYGRTVYIAIEAQPTSAGTGPFAAYR